MSIPPWTPELRGRGSLRPRRLRYQGGHGCDAHRIRRLAEERPAGMPTLVMACSVNEEHGFSGATGMARLWASGTSELVPRMPDAVIVAEPTQLNVVVAHKGVVRWRCQTRGLAATAPSLTGRERHLPYGPRAAGTGGVCPRAVGSARSPPAAGRSVAECRTDFGGTQRNTVPDACTIEIDRACFRTSVRRKPWNTSLICSINAVPACRWFMIHRI